MPKKGGESTSSGKRPQRRVSILDVADLAGVAPMTVSRAINRPNLVSAETQSSVQRAIAELGYVPNRAAGSLVSRQSGIVAALNPTLQTSIFADCLHGMWEVLEAAGYQLQVGMTEFSQAREERLVRGFLSQRVDGLVLTGIDHTDNVRSMLREWKLPVVEIWDFTDDPIDMLVGFPATDAGALVAKHFADRGYRNAGVIRAPAMGDRRSDRRADGFISTCRALGLACPPENQERAEKISTDAGARAFRALMTRRQHIDAVYCTNDTLALGALIECRRLNFPVPDRVAVGGTGDLEIASQIIPSLTTVRIDAERTGKHAATMLLSAAKGEEVEERVVDIGLQLIPREST